MSVMNDRTHGTSVLVVGLVKLKLDSLDELQRVDAKRASRALRRSHVHLPVVRVAV